MLASIWQRAKYSDRQVYVKLGIGSEAEMDFPLPLR